ncbi:hypothetical protein DXG01_006895 [Tephrocybe rancida]|nr:hypothetical protein DXG01_006895 [Tephrocybe rancida]
MAVAGPSCYIDLTLDDDDSFSATTTHASRSIPFNDTRSIIELSDDSDIGEPEARAWASTSKPTRKEDIYWSDDEIMIKAATPAKASAAVVPVASSSKLEVSHKADISADEALARSLAQEYDQPDPLPGDDSEELARRLVEEDKPENLSEDELLARRLAEEYDAELSALSVSPEDEELARKLAQQEEKNFNALLKTIDSKEDGIVFSVVVNAADDTLEDGSPAHPDDLERFRPWKQLFEKSGYEVKRFHWFVNYELEKRFEQARDRLEEITGVPSQELQLFHGTRAMNIDS